MAETDPGSPEPSQNPDPAKPADGLKVVPELDLSRGERSRTAAVARALEPTRALVERWREAGLARNMVCTIKFQAETDHATARAFAAIPGARLMHLHHNKHELTWALLS